MSAAIAERKQHYAHLAEDRRARIVRHLRHTGRWNNAFGIARALDMTRNTVARDCSILVREGRLRQELRQGEGSYQSVHYHAL